VIRALYDTLSWYKQNAGAPGAQRVLSLHKLWEELHALSINISEEAWEKFQEIAKSMGIALSSDGRWLFLFAVETYLNMVIRLIALSKMGRAPRDIQDYVNAIRGMRNVFSPTVFEWVHDAVNDPSLHPMVKSNLEGSLNTLVWVVYNLNLLPVSFDTFRVLYQGVLPSESRKSLGEFFTDESLVNEVLDAAGFGLTCDRIKEAYEKWRSGERVVLAIDPACGSGTFLVQAIRRVFKCFDAIGRVPPDIQEFVLDTIVGVDINPFAVEMAKLNIMITLAEEMSKRGALAVPRSVRVYWADSLARVSKGRKLYYETLKISIPALMKFAETSSIEVPIAPGLPRVDDLIDRVFQYAGQPSGLAQLEDWLRNAIAGTELQAYYDYILDDLRILYNVMGSIHRSGNSRVVELIKNALVVQDLVGKCLFVIGNPPWVRIHEQAPHVRDYLRSNYRWVSQGSSYNPQFARTRIPFREQFDYSVAFLERGLEFLVDGGVLGYVITSKILRSSYAGLMREELLNNYKIIELRDYSLYPRPLFQDAVNYPLIIAIEKSRPGSNHRVRILVANTAGDLRQFDLPQSELPLEKSKPRSPWVLAPERVVGVLRRLQGRSRRLGDIYEVMRGVMTSANDIYLGSIHSCSGNVINLTLENGSKVDVEEDLLHVVVRGEDIDPFKYSWSSLIIFTHDTSTLDPLWDSDQRLVLNTLGLLSQNVKARAVGSSVVYEEKLPLKPPQAGSCVQIARSKVVRVFNTLSRQGLVIQQATPCVVNVGCWKVLRGNNPVIDVSIEARTDQNSCIIEYTVSNLRIPNAPKATLHFLKNLDRLLGRDDYRASLPPWAIFRVSPDKFKEYRIAWQENAMHIEASYLPLKVDVDVCGTRVRRLLIPVQTTYFIVEEDAIRAVKLLLYFNSRLARSLVKLWAWSARGGYYRHVSYTMGHLPIPDLNRLWKCIHDLAKQSPDLNMVAKDIMEKHGEELERELIEDLNITEEEYNELVEYGNWLNEHTPTTALEGVELGEEEES
jgi:hypothetical protein